MNPEHAKAAADMMTSLWEGELAATSQVLAAVNDDKRDYKPDAKSRTAWELATHIATSDVWFLDSIINGKFEFDPEAAKQAEAQFKRVADVVEFYKKALPEKLQALRALPAESDDRDDRLLRRDAAAAGAVDRLRQQSQHPPSRPAGRLSAGDGVEGPEHLRSQRRAEPTAGS